MSVGVERRHIGGCAPGCRRGLIAERWCGLDMVGSSGPMARWPRCQAMRQDNRMTDEVPISYEAAARGTPVLSSAGSQIGTLEHVLEVPEVDESFHGRFPGGDPERARLRVGLS